MNKSKYHVSTKFKYTFTENIDQLYECFFSSDVLSKIDPLEYPYELIVENSKTYSSNSVSHNTSILRSN